MPAAELSDFEPVHDLAAVDPVLLPTPTQGELLIAEATNSETPTVFGQTLSASKRKNKRRHAVIPQQASLFSSN